MYENYLPEDSPEVVRKRLQKIKKFRKDVTSWASTAVILVGLNLIISGSLSWAKYPVGIWGLIVLAGLFDFIRLKREQREWELRQMLKQSTQPGSVQSPQAQYVPVVQTEDYSGQLMKSEEELESYETLKEVRKLSRPWKDEDLV